MADQESVKAVLAQINSGLDTVQAGVDQVQADVQTLLDRLGSIPSPNLAEIQALAEGIRDRVATVKADLDTTPRPPEG